MNPIAQTMARVRAQVKRGGGYVELHGDTLEELFDCIMNLNGRLIAIVDAAGGQVEGHPTSSVNILQRIREMREFEETHCGEYEHWRVGRQNERENRLGCNHWPGQTRCEVCGMGVGQGQ